jgi:hypothetical protein
LTWQPPNHYDQHKNDYGYPIIDLRVKSKDCGFDARLFYLTMSFRIDGLSSVTGIRDMPILITNTSDSNNQIIFEAQAPLLERSPFVGVLRN